jgi:hypothetical protein
MLSDVMRAHPYCAHSDLLYGDSTFRYHGNRLRFEAGQSM